MEIRKGAVQAAEVTRASGMEEAMVNLKEVTANPKAVMVILMEAEARASKTGRGKRRWDNPCLLASGWGLTKNRMRS